MGPLQESKIHTMTPKLEGLSQSVSPSPTPSRRRKKKKRVLKNLAVGADGMVISPPENNPGLATVKNSTRHRKGKLKLEVMKREQNSSVVRMSNAYAISERSRSPTERNKRTSKTPKYSILKPS